MIRFGRKARTRLGSIKQSQAERISNNQFPISNEIQNSKILNTDSGLLTVARMTQGEGSSLVSRSTGQLVNPTIITINGLFKDSSIPEFLIDSVIAHEMVHYAHGFASPHDKKYATPHAGGIIKKEMKERGLEDLFILQKKWLKKHWKDFVEEKLPHSANQKVRRRRRRRVVFVLR